MKILLTALQNLVNQLNKDLPKLKKEASQLPAGSEERKQKEKEIKEIEEEIAKLETIIAALSTKTKVTEVNTLTFPMEVKQLIQNTALQIASGAYDLEKPLTITINGKVIILLTPAELKKIARESSSIRNLELRRQRIAMMLTVAIAGKPEVTNQFPQK